MIISYYKQQTILSAVAAAIANYVCLSKLKSAGKKRSLTASKNESFRYVRYIIENGNCQAPRKSAYCRIILEMWVAYDHGFFYSHTCLL